MSAAVTQEANRIEGLRTAGETSNQTDQESSKSARRRSLA